MSPLFHGLAPVGEILSECIGRDTRY
jgi:hypothetical protein